MQVDVQHGPAHQSAPGLPAALLPHSTSKGRHVMVSTCCLCLDLLFVDRCSCCGLPRDLSNFKSNPFLPSGFFQTLSFLWLAQVRITLVEALADLEHRLASVSAALLHSLPVPLPPLVSASATEFLCPRC
jgi:hypothetical protein